MSSTLRNNRNARRPPRDPAAAAMRPRSTLEKAAMNSFQHRVQSANQTSICNTTSEEVGRRTLRQILSTPQLFCVPIFQRRYCWTSTQWDTLLQDAMKWSSSDSTVKLPHSLGRLTCTNTTNVKNGSSKSRIAATTGTQLENRSCILDGQQRFTTVTLLLASIRDALEKDKYKAHPDSLRVINMINTMLFPNLIQMKGWTHKPNAQLEEGIELPFARLIPTFCDRWSYYAAVLPESSSNPPTGVTASSSWHLPLVAKQYFVKRLTQEFDSLPQLIQLANNVLDGLTMLYFPVDLHDDKSNDGTTNAMVIYERLALRDATFCKPKRTEEYLSMDGADMIRNLLLGSFAEPNDSLTFYKMYWLPMERQLTEQHGRLTLSDFLQTFLNTQGMEEDTDQRKKHIIGGTLYANFQNWLTTVVASEEEQFRDGLQTSETQVNQVGQQLLDFVLSLDTTGIP